MWSVCTRVGIHDGCRHLIHLWLYSLEPCPGCRATCGDSGVRNSPSPAHCLGCLCCDLSIGHNVLSSRCVLSLVGDSAREARRKRAVISLSQTRIHVQAFTGDLFLGIAAREELALQMGIPEPRIQVSSPASAWAHESGGLSPAERLELDTSRLGLGMGLGFEGRGPKVGGLSEGFGAACGHAGTPSFPRAKGFVSRKRPCRSCPGPDRQETVRPGWLSNWHCGGASTFIWTVTTSDVPVCLFAPLDMVSKPKSSAPPAGPERARHGQAQGPGSAAAMTTPAPEDRRAHPLSRASLLPFAPPRHRRAYHPWRPKLLLLGPPHSVCTGLPLGSLWAIR